MKLSSIIALLLMMVMYLPSCTNDEDFILDTKDENGVEYISYKDTEMEHIAKMQAENEAAAKDGDLPKWVWTQLYYEHYNLFQKLPPNAKWLYNQELHIEVDKDGGLIQLETKPNAIGIIEDFFDLPEIHTHGWYFFPYFVMDNRNFTCYITHPTEFESKPQKILFGDVLRSPFCTVYGDKGALTIDVKRNDASKDRTFTVRYTMSKYDTHKSRSDLQTELDELCYQHRFEEIPYLFDVEHYYETDYLNYTQLDIVIKQKH